MQRENILVRLLVIRFMWSGRLCLFDQNALGIWRQYVNNTEGVRYKMIKWDKDLYGDVAPLLICMWLQLQYFQLLALMQVKLQQPSHMLSQILHMVITVVYGSHQLWA